MKNKFLSWWKSLFNEKTPAIHQEAHTLNSYLISTYSPEEQSKIISLMKSYLESHRLQEINQTEEYLFRLKEDLGKIRDI